MGIQWVLNGTRLRWALHIQVQPIGQSNQTPYIYQKPISAVHFLPPASSQHDLPLSPRTSREPEGRGENQRLQLCRRRRLLPPAATTTLSFPSSNPQMVLSNKKLKQKLRSLLTESLVTAEAGEAAPRKDAGKEGEVSRQLESIKDILSSKRIQRPRPPRRKKQPCSEDPTSTAGEKGEGTGDEEKESGGLDSGDRKEKKKRKRKREGAEVDGSAVKEDSKKKSKSKKNTKKAKKKKDKTKKVENVNKEEGNDGTGKESVDGCANVKEAEAVVPPNVEVREESGKVAKKVYVGGIPYYSTEDDIRSFFEGCGTITEVDCMRFPESGKFRGIAILTFKTDAAAKRALSMDEADMGGLYLKIQPYKTTRPAAKYEKSDFAPEIVDGYNRVYAGNLSWDITEDDLRNLFSDCNISSIRFGEDKTTGEFKGYAHVNFADSLSLAIALKLDQKVVCGRPVRIRCAVPPKNEKRANLAPKEKGTDTFTKGMEINTFSKDKGTDTFPKEKEAITVLKDNGATFNSMPGSQSSANGASSGNAKKKRRTCYECGVPGHVSSDCPQKKTSDA